MITTQEIKRYREIISNSRNDRTAKEVADAYVIMMKHGQGLMWQKLEFRKDKSVYW